jgi:hypothetical protein
MPDGSFYVVVETTKDMSGSPDGMHKFVMHYSENGTLIERAYIPPLYPEWRASVMKQVVVSRDGTTFAARVRTREDSPLFAMQGVDVLRLHFYPASEPLPPIPTNMPTPVIPTMVPTQESPPLNPPPAIPTGDAATPLPGPVATKGLHPLPPALQREGDGYRLDVYEGFAQFGQPPGPWIGPSRLLLEWTTSSTQSGNPAHATYLVDVENGTLKQVASFPAGARFYPDLDGKRALFVYEYGAQQRPQRAAVGTGV